MIFVFDRYNIKRHALVIKRFDVEDVAIYSCNASNNYGKIFRTFNVTIQEGKPLN